MTNNGSSGTEQYPVETRFRDLLETAPDAIIEVDREGTILLVNRAAEQPFGYGREEMLGACVEIFLPEALRAQHARDQGIYWSNPVTRPMAHNLVLSGRRKDGSDVPVEIILSPVHSEKGFRVTAIIRDVTERRIAAKSCAAYQELEARNREIERADRLKSE